MSVVALKTEAEQAFVAQYAAQKGVPPLKAVRDAAIQRFEAQGLPHRRIEAWHYTDLRSMLREPLPLARAPDPTFLAQLKADKGAAGARKEPRLFIVDGVFVPEISDLDLLPAGVKVSRCDDLSLPAEYLADNDSVVALNTAFAQAGVSIEVAAGAQIATPVHLISIQSEGARQATFPRSRVSVGAGASFVLIEAHIGHQAEIYQQNAVMGITVGDKANFDHLLRVVNDKPNSLTLQSQFIALGAHVNFSSCVLNTAGGLARRQTFLRFDGQYTTAALRGIHLLKGEQHSDTTLVVDHAVPHCNSRELFKHVIDDEARGVFQGKINVRQHAQKTDGKMMSRAVLLSEGSQMDNKPELEIFADDVLCGHGATCGELDEDLKFYLMARGIPEKDAERLLIEAFCGEVIEEMNERPIGELVDLHDLMGGAVTMWLDARKPA